MRLHRPITCLALLAALACAAAEDAASGAPGDAAARGTPAAHALDGRPLHAPALTPAESERLQRQIARAEARWRAEPDSEDAWIWYGRRLAYASRYDEALAIYSQALRRFPDSPRLLRHRGHRLITTRRFRAALLDLARAAELIQGEPDAIEEDGAPNAYGIPRSTQHSNVYYHLGLVHYLLGEYAEAERVYLSARTVSAVNDDLRVAFNWWHWLATRRMLTRLAERIPELDTRFWDTRLEDLLAPLDEPLTVLENHAYHRLLLLARGELTPEELLPARLDDTEAATLAYGVAAWHLVEGRPKQGWALCQRIVAEAPWAAFGYLAAEAELAHKAAREAAERAHHH